MSDLTVRQVLEWCWHSNAALAIDYSLQMEATDKEISIIDCFDLFYEFSMQVSDFAIWISSYKVLGAHSHLAYNYLSGASHSAAQFKIITPGYFFVAWPGVCGSVIFAEYFNTWQPIQSIKKKRVDLLSKWSKHLGWLSQHASIEAIKFENHELHDNSLHVCKDAIKVNIEPQTWSMNIVW